MLSFISISLIIFIGFVFAFRMGFNEGVKQGLKIKVEKIIMPDGSVLNQNPDVGEN